MTLLLPDGVDREAWDGYVDMREVMWKSKRVPWTERAKKIALRQLSEWHEQGYDVNYILDEAVLKGWRGLFVNDRTPRITRVTRSGITEERRQEILDQIERQRVAGRPH